MSKTIKPGEIDEAIKRELIAYHENTNEKLTEVTRKSMQDLVRKTKATAPVGKRKNFKKSITADYKGLTNLQAKKLGTIRATWYVKAPNHRLTHLLVHGHAKRNGGRTKSDPFLQNALNEVLPEYEKAVEEVLKNG